MTPADATTRMEEFGCLFPEAKQIAIQSKDSYETTYIHDDTGYMGPVGAKYGPFQRGPGTHDVTVIYETKPVSLIDMVSYHHKVAKMTPYANGMALAQMEFAPERLNLDGGFDKDPVPEIKSKSKVRLKIGKPKNVTLH
jgi:hypothetical protein